MTPTDPVDSTTCPYGDGRIVVDFDQHSPEYQARMAELSHELRNACPVVWSEHHGGFWVVTALDEVSDRVLLSFAMPNRDPKYFPDPDTVHLDRFPNRHAAFGLGNHRCIGSNIARMQFKTIMWETLHRIPDYTIDPAGVDRCATIGVINGNKHMPTTFEPGIRRGPGLAAIMANWQARLDAEQLAANAAGS